PEALRKREIHIDQTRPPCAVTCGAAGCIESLQLESSRVQIMKAVCRRAESGTRIADPIRAERAAAFRGKEGIGLSCCWIDSCSSHRNVQWQARLRTENVRRLPAADKRVCNAI